MNEQQNNTFAEKSIAYAESFLGSLTDTISNFYSTEANEIIEQGYPWLYLSLYRKVLGNDVSISVFCSDEDFFVFFTKPTGEKIREFVNMYGNPEFDSKWSTQTPMPIKTKKIQDLLKIDSSITIGEEISIPSTRFITNDISEIRRQAKGHGQSRGQGYGELSQQFLPKLRADAQNTREKLSLRSRYESLKNNLPEKGGLTPQRVGHEFERLFRDLLNLYGWQAKKIKLSGEGNDFTAIYEGHHILGETRWVKNPVSGEEVDAFASKLTPRPQTIGLMVSYSGFNQGAYGSAKRQLSSRTLVFFDKVHIEKIIIDLMDPWYVFSVELRNVYDYLLENPEKKTT